MKSFADRLKAARAVTDLTQDAVAEQLEIHRFTYSKWEQGLHPPGNPGMYAKLAKVLNCSLPWLRDGAGEGPGHYIPEPDAIKRRAVTRTPRARVDPSLVLDPAMGSSGMIDWHQAMRCLRILLEVAPKDMTPEDLAPALGLFYTLAVRSPENCSRDVAAQILLAIA